MSSVTRAQVRDVPTAASCPLSRCGVITDLDSLCSTLLLAYFRTQAPTPYTFHLTLSTLPRADLGLRTELDAVLKYTDVRPSDLLTLSDLPADLGLENTRWVLADHNALTGDLGSQFSGAIVGCVDHHEDEGKVPAECGDEPRIIRTCGSCMSLVVEYCRDVWDVMAKESPDVAADSALARVALSPILIDTTNLKSKAKTTETDIKAVELVETHISDAAYDRQAFFDEVTRVKEDISSLSYADILRKDYKQWREGGLTLGISCVVQPLDYMLEKIGRRQELVQALEKWAGEQKLDIASIMTVSHKDGQFARELLVWALNDEAVKAAERFVERFSDELQLQTWGDGELDDDSGGWRKCWAQQNLSHSRKQVAPMLREAMVGRSKI